MEHDHVDDDTAIQSVDRMGFVLSAVMIASAVDRQLERVVWQWMLAWSRLQYSIRQ